MTQIYDVPMFKEFYEAHVRVIDDIVRLADVPDELEKDCLRNPIYKFMRRAFIAPASQAHHDCESGGLVRHVLAVIRQTLLLARRDTHYDYRDRLAAFACALLHDACRPYHLVVQSVREETSSPDAPVSTWSPYESTMARWAENNHITRVSISWEKHQEVYGQSEGAAVFLMAAYFSEGFLGIVEQQRITRIANALLLKAPESGEELYRIFKGADRACVAASDRSIGKVDYGQLRAALQRAIAQVKQWNEPGSPFLSSTSHAILPFPTIKEHLVAMRFWREVFDLITMYTGRVHYVSDLGGIMLDVFQDDLVSLGQPSGGKDEFVAHALVDAKTYACIAIPWSALTGAGFQKPKISSHPPQWRLRARKDKHRLAMSVEDLGFKSISDNDAYDQHIGVKIAEFFRLMVPTPTTRDELLVMQNLSATRGVPRDLQDLALTILLSKVTAERSPLVANKRSGGRGA